MDNALILAVERTCPLSLAVLSCLSPAARRDCRTTTIVDMDRASKVLVQAPPDVTRTWAALSDLSGVPLTTLYYRAHGRPSREEKARRQQYLTVEEEKALVTFLLLMASRPP
jgi:hypothetical protein